MDIIHILIILFFILISYQIYLANSCILIEGLENENKEESKDKEYQPYNVNDPNNSLILAQQNAGNIEYLKGRMQSIDNSDINAEITDLKQNVKSMQIQIDDLVQQQATFAQEMAGSSPPDVTGTDTLTTNDLNL